MSKRDGEREDSPPALVCRGDENEVAKISYPWLAQASLRNGDCSLLYQLRGCIVEKLTTLLVPWFKSQDIERQANATICPITSFLPVHCTPAKSSDIMTLLLQRITTLNSVSLEAITARY